MATCSLQAREGACRLPYVLEGNVHLKFFGSFKPRHFSNSSSIQASRPSLRLDEADSTQLNSRPQSRPLPGPAQLPYFGTFFTHLFGKGFGKLHEQYSDWQKTYGDIYQDKIFGNRFIIVCEPSSAEKIYRSEGKWPFRDSSLAFTDILEAAHETNFTPGLIELNGKEWAELRAVLGKRLMRPLELKSYYDGFNQTALDTVELIGKTKDEKDTIHDVKDILGRWAMESIGTFAFGERTGLLDNPPDPIANKIYVAANGAMDEMLNLSRHKWAKYLMRSKYRKLRGGMQTLMEYGTILTNHIIAEIKTAAEEGRPLKRGIDKSFVAYLAGKDGMSLHDCVCHSIGIYFVGLDTTSTTTAWLLYALGINPDAQEELFQEISKKMPEDGMLTFNAAQDMPYLRACMKEAQRLYSGIPSLLRFPEEDIEVQGYTIPAKSNVFIHQRTMCLSDEYFPEAQKFLPQRWIRHKDDALPNPFLSLHFGYGPRMCVGKRVAEAEMQAIVTQLLKKFRIKYTGKPQTGIMKLMVVPEHPLTFQFVER